MTFEAEQAELMLRLALEPPNANRRVFWYQQLEPFYHRHGLLEVVARDLQDAGSGGGRPAIWWRQKPGQGER